MVQVVLHLAVQIGHHLLQIIELPFVVLDGVLKLCGKVNRILLKRGKQKAITHKHTNLPSIFFSLLDTLVKSFEALSFRSWARFFSDSLTCDFWSSLPKADWYFFSSSSAP